MNKSHANFKNGNKMEIWMERGRWASGRQRPIFISLHLEMSRSCEQIDIPHAIYVNCSDLFAAHRNRNCAPMPGIMMWIHAHCVDGIFAINSISKLTLPSPSVERKKAVAPHLDRGGGVWRNAVAFARLIAKCRWIEFGLGFRALVIVLCVAAWIWKFGKNARPV